MAERGHGPFAEQRGGGRLARRAPGPLQSRGSERTRRSTLALCRAKGRIEDRVEIPAFLSVTALCRAKGSELAPIPAWELCWMDIWLILPHPHLCANEDWRLRVRNGILNAASGIFIRVEIVHKCPFGEWSSPFCHLHLPVVAARDGVAAPVCAQGRWPLRWRSYATIDVIHLQMPVSLAPSVLIPLMLFICRCRSLSQKRLKRWARTPSCAPTLPAHARAPHCPLSPLSHGLGLR